jgi:hypothetical protein
LTVGGIFSVARALNGTVPASALVATPLAYNWPFYFGFVNFSLAAATALLVLALWIRMRSTSLALRFVIFVPLSFLTWVFHTAGWGLLSLAVFGFEVVRIGRERGFRVSSAVRAAIQTLPFAVMLLVTVFWRQRSSGQLGISFASNLFESKATFVLWLFQEKYFIWDVTALILFFALVAAFFFASGRRLVPEAAVICVLLWGAYLVTPYFLFGSAYADARLLPYAALFLPLAVMGAHSVPADRVRAISLLASLALLFFVARIGVTTHVWAAASRLYAAHLALLEEVPVNSRIFALMLEPCGNDAWGRAGLLQHLQQIAVVRRDSLINGLFQGRGLNPLVVESKGEGDRYLYRQSTVRDDSCTLPYIPDGLQTLMKGFPATRFDYVWIMSMRALPEFSEHGLQLIAQRGNDRLYRVLQPQ